MSKDKEDNKKTVLSYLAKENRPLSATDIANNLNGALTKTGITNALDDLAAEQRIIEKVYGKQRVFMTLQNVDCTNLKQDLRQLEEKIIVIKGETGRIKMENNRLEGEIRNAGDKTPLPELESQIKSLFDEVESLKERLGQQKSAKVEVVSKEEKIKIQNEYEKYNKLWRKYKRIANEIIATIVENCDIRKPQLCEDLGLVLDEHVNAQIPS